MTTEEKKAWLVNASTEELLRQYESSYAKYERLFEITYMTVDEILENYELAKNELLRRLGA